MATGLIGGYLSIDILEARLTSSFTSSLLNGFYPNSNPATKENIEDKDPIKRVAEFKVFSFKIYTDKIFAINKNTGELIDIDRDNNNTRVIFKTNNLFDIFWPKDGSYQVLSRQPMNSSFFILKNGVSKNIEVGPIRSVSLDDINNILLFVKGSDIYSYDINNNQIEEFAKTRLEIETIFSKDKDNIFIKSRGTDGKNNLHKLSTDGKIIKILEREGQTREEITSNKKYLLVAPYDGDTYGNLELANLESGQIKKLDLKTSPDKCTWSELRIICAGPRSEGAGDGFNDIYSIDPRDGKVSILIKPEGKYLIKKPQIDPESKDLFFINDFDSYLYKLGGLMDL